MQHQFSSDGLCIVCRQPASMANWWRLADLGCPGVRWLRVADLAHFPYLATLTTLRAMRHKPRELAAPVACYFSAQARAYRMLYDVREAIALRPVTDRQGAALALARQRAREARTCTLCRVMVRHKAGLERMLDGHRLCDLCAVRWHISRGVSAMLDTPGAYAILDTETTGLYADEGAEIVEIAVLGLDGTPLLDTLIKPRAGIPSDSFIALHGGITDALVSSSPAFSEVYPRLAAAIADRKVLIYNQAFDVPMVGAECERLGLASPLTGRNSECVMLLYAEYVGEWSSYWCDYRWQPLPHGGHRAMDDCRAVLALLRRIAGAIPPSPYPAPSPEETAVLVAAANDLPF